jgi:hypothetical protein
MAIDSYLQRVMRIRGITESQLSTVTSGGGNHSGGNLPEGKTLHRFIQRDPPGNWQGWFAISRGGNPLTAWFSHGQLGNAQESSNRTAGALRQALSKLLSAVQLEPFSSDGRQYYALSSQPVAHSLRIEPLVIADYAGDGSVRGIEIVGKVENTIEVYLRKALSAGDGQFGEGRSQLDLTISNVTMNYIQPGAVVHGHARKQVIQGAGGSSDGTHSGPIIHPWVTHK